MESLPDANKLIPTQELIRLALSEGLFLGNGDPQNYVRYLTKVGLLPPARRLAYGGSYTVGHYPLSALTTLREINAYVRAGWTIQQIVTQKTQANLDIPTTELINRARLQGIYLGSGDPYNYLRYLTKLGILPNATRQAVPGSASTVGHYPVTVVETLREVEQKLRSGMTIQQIAAEYNQGSWFVQDAYRSEPIKPAVIEHQFGEPPASTPTKTSANSTQVAAATPHHFPRLTISKTVVIGATVMVLMLVAALSIPIYLTGRGAGDVADQVLQTLNVIPPREGTLDAQTSYKQEADQNLGIKQLQDATQSLADQSQANHDLALDAQNAAHAPITALNTDADNSIENSSYELNNSGSPQAWDYLGLSTAANTYVSQDYAHTDKNSLRLDLGSLSSGGIIQHQTTTRSNGQNALSVWVKGSNLSYGGYVRLGFKDSSGFYSSRQDFYIGGNSDWQRLTLTANGSGLTPALEVKGYRSGTLYLDDWQLTGGSVQLQYAQHNELGQGALVADGYGNFQPAVDKRGNLGSPTNRFSALFLAAATIDNKGNMTIGGSVTASGSAEIKGDLTLDGGIKPITDNQQDLGTPTNRFRNVYATSLTTGGGTTNGDQTITGNLTVNGSGTFGNGLTVNTGSTNLSGVLNANGGIVTNGASINAGAGAISTTGSITGATLTTSGNASIGGTLVVSGATTVNNTLTVTGTSTLADLITSGQIKLTGNAADRLLIQPSVDPVAGTNLFTVKNAAGTTTELAITNDGKLTTQTLHVINASTLDGAVTVGSLFTLNANFTQTGNTTFSTGSGAVSLNGNTSITGSNSLTVGSGVTPGGLTVNGAATFNNGITTNNTNVNAGTGTVSAGAFSGGSFAGTTLTTTGNASVGGTLGVTGATTLSSTLAVTGVTTLTGQLNANGGIVTNNANINAGTGSISGGAITGTTLTTSGNASVGGTLGVTGATTLSNSLSVTGNTSLSTVSTSGLATLNSASVTGNETVGGTLGVTGTSTLGVLNAGQSTFTANNATYVVTVNQQGTGDITDFQQAGVTRLVIDNSGNLVPAINNTETVGTAAKYFNNGYFTNLNVNNLSVTTTNISGTTSTTFTLDTGNSTNDTQNQSLIFFRGTATPNALLTWNSTTKQFEFNFGVMAASTLTDHVALIAKGATGQTADLFEAQSSTGGVLASISSGGNLSVTGTSTLTGQLNANGGIVTNNANVNAGSGTVTGGTITDSGLTPGSVVFAGTGGVLSQNNANFFWDNTNNRLGIGTGSPTSIFNVNQSSNNKSGIQITGYGYAASSPNDSANGVGVYLNYNASGNRQMLLGATDALGSSTLGLVRLQTGTTGYTGIDAVAGNGINRLPVIISSDTQGAGVGYTSVSVDITQYTAKLNVFNYNDSIATLNLRHFGTANGNYLEVRNSANTVLNVIDANGNVGIGTTNPGTTLDINSGGGGNKFRIWDGSTTGLTVDRLGNANFGQGVLVTSNNTGSYPNTLIGNGIYSSAVTSESNLFTITPGTLTVSTALTNQRFTLFNAPTITSSTAQTVTNAATLAIAGAPAAAGSTTITNPYALWVQGFPAAKPGASQLIVADSSATNAFNGNGNGTFLGVNTAASFAGNLADFQVNGSSKFSFGFTASTSTISSNGNELHLYSGGSNGVVIGSGSYDLFVDPGAHRVTVGNYGGGSRLSVNGNLAVGSSYYNQAAPTDGAIIQGNVGIGTSSPGSSLQINGGAAIGFSSSTVAPTNGLQVAGNALLTSNSNAIGSGATTQAYAQLRINGSGNGDGTNLRGIQIAPIVNGAITGSYYGLSVQDTINASAATIAERDGIFIASPTISAGTLTNNFGLTIANQSGATNNTNLVIGSSPVSGNYSIYNSSTANNVLAGNTRIGSSIAPTVTLDVTGAANVSTNLTTPTVYGSGVASGSLTLTGTSNTTKGEVLLPDAKSTTTALVFGGDANADLYNSAVSTLKTDGNFIVGSNLTVNGGSTLLGNTSISGTLGVTGATTLSNTLTVSGATQINSTLGVTGAATFSSTGTFTGALTGNGGTTTNSLTVTTPTNPASAVVLVQNTNAIPTGNLLQLQSGATPVNKFVVDTSGNVTVSGTLGVTGSTSLSTLATTGVATLNSLSVTNNATVGGTFGVTGTTTLSGQLNANGGINVNGNSVINTSGQIGIGTTTPQQALNLASNNSIAINMVTPSGLSGAFATGGSLTLNQTYYWTVTALDGNGGETVNSNVISATPTVSGTQSYNLSWTAVQGAFQYRVYRNTTNSFTSGSLLVTTVTTNTYIDTGTVTTSGFPPTVTTSYVDKIAASGNSYFLGGNVGIGTASPGSLLTVNGTFTSQGVTVLNNNVTLGATSSNQVTFNGLVSSNIIPSAGSAYDLGTSANHWRQAYIDTLNVTTNNATGTINTSFTINQNNTTNDTQDSFLYFHRGTATPDAYLKWNSTLKQLETNFPLQIGGNFAVAGNTTLSGTLAANGAVTLTSTFSQTGTNTFSTGTGAVSLNGNTSVTGTATFSVGTGATTLGGSLGVTGAATFSSTGTFSGLLTANGGVNTNSIVATTAVNPTNSVVLIQNTNASPTGNLLQLQSGATPTNKFVVDAAGNVTVAGTLVVTGATTLSTLSTSGAATLNSLGVTNNATVGGTLGVTGATTLSSTTTINGQLNSQAIIPQSNIAYNLGSLTNYFATEYLDTLNVNTINSGATNLGKTTITANTTDYALEVNQQGTGDIARFQKAGVTKVTVDNGGNLSTVAGSAITSGGTLTASNGFTQTTGALSLTASSGSAALTLTPATSAFNINSGTFDIDTQNSRVGIGTVTPHTNLEIFKSGSASPPALDAGTGLVVNTGGSPGNFGSISVISGATGTSSLFLGSTNGEFEGAVRYNNSTNALSLATVGTTRLTIDQNGNTGIGTSAPSYKLDVNGTARVQSSTLSVLDSVNAEGTTTNLVANPSMEAWTGSIPTSWTTSGANVTTSQVTGHFGSYAVRFSSTVGGNTSTNRLTENPGLSINTTYTISYYARRVTGTGALQIAIDNSSANIATFTDTTGNWVRVSQTITTSSTSAGSINFYPSVANDTFDIDDVQVEQSATLTSFTLSARNANTITTGVLNSLSSAGSYFLGNVGFGTTTTGSAVTLANNSSIGWVNNAGTTTNVAKLDSANNLSFRNNSGGNLYLGTVDASTRDYLQTGGVGRVLVDSTGNVGIGAVDTSLTSPKNTLDVGGSLSIGSYAGVNAAPSNGLIVSGNVGIGTATGINVPLTIGGREYVGFDPANSSASGGTLQVGRPNNINSGESFLTLRGDTVTINTGFTTFSASSFNQPTLTIASGQTITNAATLAIQGAPLNNGVGTLTNSYSLWVQGGNSLFSGNVTATGSGTFASLSTTGSISGGAGSFTTLTSTQTTTLATNGTSGAAIGTSSTVAGGGLTIAPSAATSGTPSLLTITAPADTTLTAAEAVDINLNLARTVQFTGSATPGAANITTQRAALIQAPTYSFSSTGAQTITNAATLAISGSPIAGTNATITNPYALWVQGGTSRFDGLLGLNGNPTGIGSINSGLYLGSSVTSAASNAVGLLLSPTLTASANNDRLVTEAISLGQSATIATNNLTVGEAGGLFVGANGFNKTGTGTVTTAYGIRIDAPTIGSTNYALLVNSGNSYFQGNVTSNGTISQSGLTQGSVVFAGSGGALSQNNGQFFWDNTNNKLGIDTNSPGSQLQVNTGLAGNIGQIIRASASQSADLLQFQASSSGVMSAFSSDARLRIGTGDNGYQLDVVGSGGNLPFRAYRANTSGSIADFQGTTGIILDVTNSSVNIGNSGNGGTLGITTGASAVGEIIQASSGQTADLQRWINYNGSQILASIGGTGNFTLAPSPSTSGTPGALETITGPSHTGLANAEASDINWNLARTVQFTGGASTSITNQRAALFQAPTYSAATAGLTITNAATLAISGAPTAGTNATITNPYALWVQGGTSRFDGDVKFTGNLYPSADATYDIGNSTANLRWRSVALSGSINFTGTANQGGVSSNSVLLWNGTVNASGGGTGVFNTYGGTLAASSNNDALNILSVQSVTLNSGTGLTGLSVKGLNADLSGFSKTGTGTVANSYAVYANAATLATNNYSIYSASGVNYFGGNVGIGTNTFGTNNKLLINSYNTVDNLATAQITTTNATNKGLVLQGSLSQSADLIQIQNSSGALYSSISSTGRLNFTTVTGDAGPVINIAAAANGSSTSGILNITNTGNAPTITTTGDTYLGTVTASGFGLFKSSNGTSPGGNPALRGINSGNGGTGVIASSQAGNAFETYYDFGGSNTLLTSIDNNGSLSEFPRTASTIGIKVKGFTSQTADLLQLQNSAGTVLSSITSAGLLRVTAGAEQISGNGDFLIVNRAQGSAITFQSGDTTATTTPAIKFNNANGGQIGYIQSNGTTLLGQVTAYPANTSFVDLIAHAAIGQTADLQQWVAGDGVTVLDKVNATGSLTISPSALTSGSPSLLTITAPADTTLTASEFNDINFNLARTVQFTGSATPGAANITTQRAALIQAPTYSFSSTGAQTITNAATLAITGAPLAGTNATITNPYALWVQGGNSLFSGNVTLGNSSLGGTVTDSSPFALTTAADSLNNTTSALYITSSATANHRIFFGTATSGVYAVNFSNTSNIEGVRNINGYNGLLLDLSQSSSAEPTYGVAPWDLTPNIDNTKPALIRNTRVTDGSTSVGFVLKTKNALSNAAAKFMVLDNGGTVLQNIFANGNTTYSGSLSVGSNNNPIYSLDLNGNAELTDAINNGYGGIGRYENELINSETFNGSGWAVTNVTVTKNVTGPNDVTNSATTLADSVSGGNVKQTGTAISTSNNFVGSIWVKTTSGTQAFDLRIDSGNVTGTVQTYTATTSWHRYMVTQTFNGASTGNATLLIFPGQVAGSGTVVAYGAQLEKTTNRLYVSNPGTYIRTTSNVVAETGGVVSNGGIVTVSDSTTDTPFIAIAAPSQTSNLAEFRSAANVAQTVISASGNLGIGTTSPQQSLTLASGDNLATNMATPAAPTPTGSTTGGSMAAGTYYYVITALDGAGGETVAGTQSSAVTTTGTTSSVALAWTAIQGAASYKVYRTTTSGTYTTPAYIANPTTNSYTDTAVSASTGAPPSITTAYVNKLNASGTSNILGGNLNVLNTLQFNSSNLAIGSFIDSNYLTVRSNLAGATGVHLYDNANLSRGYAYGDTSGVGILGPTGTWAGRFTDAGGGFDYLETSREIYPGYINGVAGATASGLQGNYYWAGSPSYGLYTNTGVYAASGYYSAITSTNVYGSIMAQGSNGGYAGVYFPAMSRTLMVNATYQGIYDPNAGSWQWYWTNGTLTQGTVPAANISAGTFGSGSYTMTGNLTVGSSSALVGAHPTYGSAYAAFWKSGSDYAILDDGSNTFVNAPATTGTIYFREGNTSWGNITSNYFQTQHLRPPCDQCYDIGESTLRYFAIHSGSFFGTYNAGPDVAEKYQSDVPVTAGDVVDQSTNSLNVTQSQVAYSTKIMGVISSNPGIVMGDQTGYSQSGNPVALIGRVPVKVSMENGSIAVGDPLTSSSTPGVAMKATKAARIIGYALEAYTQPIQESYGVYQHMIRPNTTPAPYQAVPSTNGSGKIMVFVHVENWDPNSPVYSPNGTVSGTTSSSNDPTFNSITASVANLTTINVGTTKIFTDPKGNLTINGNLIVSGNGQFVNLHVTGDLSLDGNIISPNGLQVRLGSGKSFQVADASGSAKFSVNDQGSVAAAEVQVATGSATFTTGSTSGAMVTPDTYDFGSASIGTATMKAASKDLLIKTTKVHPGSKIFITFNGNYSPATRYWTDTVSDGASFMLHLDLNTAAGVTVNFWIVN